MTTFPEDWTASWKPDWFTGVMSAWPRRLLHIPTMTSLERQEGNIYGGYKEPQYSTLSYTWGRWPAPGGTSIKVKGVTWEIPAVKEERFTVTAFLAVLERMSKETQYAWVDVACIDQENRKIKMDEIGRQAGIFKNAYGVFLWLNGMEPKTLQHHMDTLFTIGPELLLHDKLEKSGLSQRLSQLSKAITAIFSDPWFSSLWTLQESILRRDALVLSSRAELVPLSYMEGHVSLKLLANACYNIYFDLRFIWMHYVEDSQIVNIARQMHKKIEEVGCYTLYSSNPNILYGVARFRETRDELDRIYGIMQVYNLQLGESKQPGVHPTLEQLEDEFAVVLNSSKPVLAQLFVHSRNPRKGKSWRITQHSGVPDDIVAAYSHDDKPLEISHSTISFQSSGQVLAKGKSWSMKEMVGYWAYWRLSFLGSMLQIGNPRLDLSLIVLLDDCDHIPKRFNGIDLRGAMTSNPNPSLLASPLLETSLIKFIGGADLRWFLVGELPGSPIPLLVQNQTYTKNYVGLILRRCDSENWWERIGIGLLDPGDEFSIEEQPKAPCPGWEVFEGRLG